MIHQTKFQLFVMVLCGLLLNGFCLAETAAGNASKTSIAVFPCKAVGGVTMTEVSFITERITMEILRQDIFTVIDKYEISKRTGIRDMDLCGSISNVTIYFDLGGKCGADQVIWGSLTRKGAVLQLDLYLGRVPARQPHDSCSTSLIGSTLELSEQVPLILGKLFHLTVSATASPSAGGVSRIVYAPIQQPLPTKLTINTEPEGARVFLNNVEAGVTPYVRDSLKVGTYICRLEKYGYSNYSEKIILYQNADKKMMVRLDKLFGSLTVNSTPAAAALTLSNGITGRTPFTCDTLMAGLYNLNLALDGYAPFKQTVSIARKKCDTVTAQLVSLKYLDSLKQVARRKNRLVRRIMFGTLTAGFFGTGLYFNSKAAGARDEETSAYAAYQQLNGSSTQQEFAAAYDRVEASRKEVDSYCGTRNVLYIISAVFGGGLGISIKF
jgi:hypothetical protein